MQTAGQRLWNLCCSLKLAIVLASLATLLAIFGSLVIYAHPTVFGDLDQHTLATWWRQTGSRQLEQTWWMPLLGLLALLLAVNTFCCLLEWLRHLRHRWRKLGEYLIHAGFVLVSLGFLVGHLYGFRIDRAQVFEGELFPISPWPGHYLRLERFEPRFGEQGQPLDMYNDLSLLRGEERLVRQVARINHPLQYAGLVVVPLSFGRQAQGFRVFQPGKGNLLLRRGSRLETGTGAVLHVEAFLPDAVKGADGRVRQRSGRLEDPAMLLRLERPDGEIWRGWYWLRSPLPYPLVSAGIRFWPVEPIFASYSLLTINYDPGINLALTGAVLLLAGTALTLVSYYRKRRIGDHPLLD
ncbi:cytochrome c biogenesis protein [Geothermobacter ehrlichii]|uniref:Cytochrome c biogenesis protein n=1 Tax=Geothermobacter ehrlichii TaxID=213224 RepID=A0A5D3WMJ0_9BACT|nr:cytochrome c biogenesis protein ResB [Geothermobacter ehrlichii]TYO98756.1 cytochrome c biogenesis protein [Geothermobacter ehrlichii]